MKRCLALLFALAVTTAAAEPVPAEVSARFARATRLYNQHNELGALTEFEKVYAQLPRPGVLFNIALIQASLKRPLDCIKSLDALLASPGNLSADRLARAQALRTQQRDLVGEVVVKSDVDGVEVSIGGVGVGKTPLPGPVLVPAGRTVVAGQASKRKPAYQETDVASNTRVEMKLELLPLEQAFAQVNLKTTLPGADVFVDNVRVGTTPNVSKFPIEPGERVIQLRRDGYVTATAKVMAGEGTEIEVPLELNEDPPAIEARGATLSVKFSETQVVASVDGKRIGLMTGPLKLAPGLHRLMFERGGFYPVQRDVQLTANETRELEVTFEPTADYRAELERGVALHRLLGVVGLGVGVALGAVGGAVLKYNSDSRTLLLAKASFYAADSFLGCPSLGMGDCIGRRNAINDQLNGVDGVNVTSYVLLGLGALAIVGGVFSFATTPNLAKYEQGNTSDVLAPVELSLVPSIGPNPGFALSGRF